MYDYVFFYHDLHRYELHSAPKHGVSNITQRRKLSHFHFGKLLYLHGIQFIYHCFKLFIAFVVAFQCTMLRAFALRSTIKKISVVCVHVSFKATALSPWKLAFVGEAKVCFYLQPRSLFVLQTKDCDAREVNRSRRLSNVVHIRFESVIKVKNVKCVSVKCKRKYLKSL